jgi:hypothetical protein
MVRSTVEISDDMEALEWLKQHTDLGPRDPMYTVVVHMTKCHVEFANMFRRVLMTSCPMKHLVVTEIETDDVYAIKDYITQNIKLLPVIQDCKEEEVTLDVRNTGQENIHVFSDSFGECVVPNIAISLLRPQCFLKVHATVNQTIGRLIGNFIYKDVKYREDDNSLDTVRDEYDVGYTTNRNVEPLVPMQLACHAIKDTLDRFSYVEAAYVEGVSKFITSEIHLAPVIAKYCFTLTDGNIPYISFGKDHPDLLETAIYIKHPEAKKLIKDAVTAIGKDVDVILKSVSG